MLFPVVELSCPDERALQLMVPMPLVSSKMNEQLRPPYFISCPMMRIT
jgi:hypothetical protein